MRTATAIPVPHGPIDQEFIARVNERAGRQVITTHKTNDQRHYVTNVGTVVKAGQFVLITDAVGSTNAALYQIVDRMELLG